MNSISYQEYLAPCCAIAKEAGTLLMGYFSTNFETRHKEDKSPVTDADIEANTLICKKLQALTPEIPVIAEEDDPPSLLRSYGATGEGEGLFWLVDPLDGTRSFVRGEAEFTVNIGLVHNHKPVLGVIYSPPQGMLYYGEPGHGAFRVDGDGKITAIKTRAPSPEGLVVIRSRSHPSAKTSAYLKALPIKKIIPSSSAIKFCVVAEGSADIYPRFGRTMEWDTAAGHAIILAAGGRVETADGKPLTYGKPGFDNPPFIAFGK